MHGTQRNACLD